MLGLVVGIAGGVLMALPGVRAGGNSLLGVMLILLALGALGALGTCVANVVMAVAAGRFGATKASATGFLIPVVALVLGIAVRGERVAAISIAGGGVCLIGAWLIRRTAVS